MATLGREIIMEDDMKPGSAPMEPSDLRKLNELSAYRVDRQKAELWAHRDIKFLVYDDTNLQQNGYDSDDEEGMVEFAMMISGGSDPVSEDESGNLRERENEDWDEEVIRGGPTSSAIPDDTDGIHEDREGTYEEPEDCSFCLSVPEFPRSFKPRKFRLVQSNKMVSDPDEFKPGGPYVCSHYVAVSYCWPVPQQDEHGKSIMTPGSYQVRDLDGAVRSSRALDNILDRAVEFAVSCGIRMIWIDQECLPQPKEDSPQEHKDEQELGVQAMDVVYNRACLTAGLLSASITSQDQMDAVATLRSFAVTDSGSGVTWDGVGEAPLVTDISHLLYHALDFLEIVSADRWYTRAWVAQEALSAGEVLVLLLPLGAGISYECLLELGEPEELPLIAELPPRDGSQPSTIGISMTGFQHLVRVAKCLFYTVYNRVGDAMHPRAWSIIEKAEELHPTAPQPKILSERMFIPGGNNYRPRQTADAAGALTLLRTRGCRDVQDRIAIVANMCNFENRLNTNMLARHCKSLRLALVALTVLNGDYSLLVPEAYALKTHEGLLPRSETGMGWLWPLNLAPHKLNYYRLRHAGFLSASQYNFGETFTPDGLRLDAHVWTVEDTIDFTVIQREWAEKWNSLKPLRVALKKEEGETTEEAEERQRAVVQSLCKDLTRLQNVREAALLGCYVFEAGKGYGDVEFVASVAALPMIDTPETQRCIAEIVFAILRHLYLNSHSERQAIGLANSIWHSLRVDAVSTKAEELPDDVGDWLFSHPDVDDDPSVLLQLDETLDDSFGQAWLIERIMRDGFLWVGRYLIPVSPKDSASNSTSRKGFADEAPDSQISNPGKSASRSESILSRQMQRKMIASMAIITALPNSDDRVKHATMGMDRRNLVSFMSACNQNLHSNEHHEACARDLVSAFDVDGPCLVAIPRNADLEVLPRPALRSMSVCWVVEPVIRTKDRGGERREHDDPSSSPANSESPARKEPIREHEAKSNGLRAQRDASSELVIGSAERAGLAVQQPILREDNEEPPDECGEEYETLYKVLNKVRGLWQIKDYPMHRYKFM